ncbi:GrpB family protein [Microlunatus soli]|nr:GrpB family protein [Microlunatus soli]
MSTSEVVGYDECWPAMFREIATAVDRALDEVDHGIEHIGSTSVPGLAAKPIIDLFAVVPTADQMPAVIAALVGAGWGHEGDGGLSGRERFASRPDLPYHHLYVVVRGNRQHTVQLRFRDILRTDANARELYAARKYELAPLLRTDRTAYNAGKSDLIASILDRDPSNAADRGTRR